MPPNASAEVAVFASTAPDPVPDAAGLSSSLGGAQAVMAIAATPATARMPARRVKGAVMS